MNHSQPKVLILLSTYNGEFFLLEQLNSIMNQKGVDVHLMIRDDGSLDNTISIINEFKIKYKKVIIHEENNIGCANSYIRLLNMAYSLKEKFDYYAFSDQDDVWLENKLEIAINNLKCMDENKPNIYLGQTQMVDAELNYINTPQLNLKGSFGESLVKYVATGCTEVFNYSLLKIVNTCLPTFFTMHDTWVYQVCLSVGGSAFFDNKSYVLYRQHNQNVLGGKTSFFKTWKRRINETFFHQGNVRSKTAESILNDFEMLITNNNKEILHQIIGYRYNIKKRICLLFNKQLKPNKMCFNINFKIAVILGLY